jgi:hypothetical protein
VEWARSLPIFDVPDSSVRLDEKIKEWIPVNISLEDPDLIKKDPALLVNWTKMTRLLTIISYYQRTEFSLHLALSVHPVLERTDLSWHCLYLQNQANNCAHVQTARLQKTFDSHLQTVLALVDGYMLLLAHLGKGERSLLFTYRPGVRRTRLCHLLFILRVDRPAEFNLSCLEYLL